MPCSNCYKSSSSIKDTTTCVLKAFENIKVHFLDLTNIIQDKDRELNSLKAENIELKAQFKNYNIARRRTTDVESTESKTYLASEEYGANLNIALNSEQLFELSKLSTSSIDNDEGKNSATTKLFTTNDKENVVKHQGNTKKVNNNKIINSQQIYYSVEEDDESLRSPELRTPSFLRTHKPNIQANRRRTQKKEKKTNANKRFCLSPNTSNLNDYMTTEKSSRDDMIMESPDMNMKSALKKSLIHSRVASRGKKSINQHKQRQQMSNLEKDNQKTARSIEEITFDFSADEQQINDVTNIQGIHLRSCTQSNDETMKFNKINPVNSETTVCGDYCPDTAASVMLLPSEPKEVVFIDDTSTSFKENENTESIDAKYDKLSVRNQSVKRENKQETKRKIDRNTTKSAKDVNDTFSGLSAVQPSFINPLFVFDGVTEKHNDDLNYVIDKEKNIKEKQRNEKDDDDEEENSMPKPFQIKQEPGIERSMLEENRKSGYLEQEHIQRPNTPEGFWNPHLLSFATDDIRNEVLIDNRFKNL